MEFLPTITYLVGAMIFRGTVGGKKIEKCYLECLFRRSSNRAAGKHPCGTWRRSCQELAGGTKALVLTAQYGKCQRIAAHFQ